MQDPIRPNRIQREKALRAQMKIAEERVNQGLSPFPTQQELMHERIVARSMRGGALLLGFTVAGYLAAGWLGCSLSEQCGETTEGSQPLTQTAGDSMEADAPQFTYDPSAPTGGLNP